MSIAVLEVFVSPFIESWPQLVHLKVWLPVYTFFDVCHQFFCISSITVICLLDEYCPQVFQRVEIRRASGPVLQDVDLFKWVLIDHNGNVVSSPILHERFILQHVKVGTSHIAMLALNSALFGMKLLYKLPSLGQFLPAGGTDTRSTGRI